MSWLGRYEVPLPIRCRGAFHLYSTRERAGGEPRTIVVPAPHAAMDAAARSLAALASAHGALVGGVAPVAEHGVHEALPFVALACDAACDGEAIIAHLGETRTRVAYPEAMAVVDAMTSAILAAHEAPAPAVLGALSWANVLILRDGRIALLGFGHNVVAFDELGGLSGAPSVFIAPEVAAGSPATPGADVYAFVLLQRSVLSYIAVPAALERAFLGELDASNADVAALVGWSNERVVTAPPPARASMREARAQFEREWALLGMRPDHEALERRLAAIAANEAPAAEVADESETLTLGPDGAWLRAPTGETFELRGRGPLRRLLLRLARHRRVAPGASLDVDALLEAGWPGERPIREAGLNRVYVAISSLRKLGLRDVIQRDDRGYRIDPAVQVRIEGVDPPSAARD